MVDSRPTRGRMRHLARLGRFRLCLRGRAASPTMTCASRARGLPRRPAAPAPRPRVPERPADAPAEADLVDQPSSAAAATGPSTGSGTVRGVSATPGWRPRPARSPGPRGRPVRFYTVVRSSARREATSATPSGPAIRRSRRSRAGYGRMRDRRRVHRGEHEPERDRQSHLGSRVAAPGGDARRRAVRRRRRRCGRTRRRPPRAPRRASRRARPRTAPRRSRRDESDRRDGAVRHGLS